MLGTNLSEIYISIKAKKIHKFILMPRMGCIHTTREFLGEIE